jgi:Plasmid pRiA4b ORF-3-like protein/Cytochrome c
MGWFDYHLWQFTIGKQRYGPPMDDDWGTKRPIDASKVRLRDVLKPRKTVIDYIYDFGDCKGVARLFPSLADSSIARSDDPTSLLRLVLRGSRSVATKNEPTGPGMPSFAWQLDDEQIAAVATYVRNHWGSPAPAVSPSEVGRQRSSLAKRAD